VLQGRFPGVSCEERWQDLPKIPKLRRLLRINLILREIGELTSELFVSIGSVALLLEILSQDDHKVIVSSEEKLFIKFELKLEYNSGHKGFSDRLRSELNSVHKGFSEHLFDCRVRGVGRACDACGGGAVTVA
jgi:hypothetical protein